MVFSVTVSFVLLVCLTTDCWAGQAGETKSTPGSAGGERVVQEYLLAREDAEMELDEFYRNSPPDTLPDPNTDTMIELRYWRQQVMTAGLSEEDLTDLLTGDPGLPASESSAESSGHEPQRRSITASTRSRWTKAIVPYAYTDEVSESGRNEIQRSMQTFERLTCIRFVVWENDTQGVTTNDELQLGHPSYAKFVASGGCWSYVGNIRRASGQTISCCGGATCIHELGHMFGEYHEQQSPSPDRNRFIRINYNNIQESGKRWYSQKSGGHIKNTGFDLNSPMHYATWMFGNGNGPTFARLFPELRERGGFYYLMREVSVEHGCQDQCTDSNLVCENEGYLTKVDDQCTCRCIPGLDPNTGCTSILKADPPGLEFPGGKWAIPAHQSGCPDDSFLMGSWTQVNDGGNVRPSNYDLKGSVTSDTVESHFCVRDAPDTDFFWPGANLCVYRRESQCPEGFSAGYVQYDDTDGTGSRSGDLPDGDFGEDTRFEFCCKTTGFSFHPLNLPSRKPFVLFHNGRDKCQAVRGMHSREVTLRVANVMFNGTTLAATGGHNPASYDERRNTFQTNFCSYQPAMIDCGDILTVDANNPELTITSPSGSELECYWLIKAPAGERLQMDFTSFDISGKPGQCEDELEVRYSRQGQPGRIYCGQSWEKTTISINNTLHIRLSTYGESSSQFSATVKLVQDSQLCYQADDNGLTYAGDINFTRDFQTCLPWHEMGHCLHHPFNIDIFNTILLGNKCRNPDSSRGFQPWCYTEKSQCERNYCDVCQLGTLYDARSDCVDLKSRGLCDEAMTVCAKTCTDLSPDTRPANELSCPAPGAAPDGVMNQPKSSYAVGERVTYKCNYNNSTRDRMCLSTGQWSVMGQVCSVCPAGWHQKETTQLCHSPVFPAVYFADAQSTCASYGAIVSTAKSEEDNNYLKSLARSYGDMWLGLTDIAEEGTWLWEDGDEMNFTSWFRGEPNDWGGREDCAVVNRLGNWNDLPCTGYSRKFVCESGRSALQDCLDFSDHCADLFQLQPSMCVDFPEFAEEQCRYTCGRCLSSDSGMCPLGELGSHVITQEQRWELPRGDSVTFSCDEGYVRVSGDTVRGCDMSGSLTGTALQCVEDCPSGWHYLEEELACYQYFPTKERFTAAEAACEGHGAMLTTSQSPVENSLILDIRLTDVWIGLNDTSNEGDFVWSDGKPLIWARWRSGEPNDWRYGEDCVVMRRDGHWDDRHCSYRYAYVCKMALPALTATSTTSKPETAPTSAPTTMKPATTSTSAPTTMKPATSTSAPTVQTSLATTKKTTDACED